MEVVSQKQSAAENDGRHWDGGCKARWRDREWLRILESPFETLIPGHPAFVRETRCGTRGASFRFSRFTSREQKQRRSACYMFLDVESGGGLRIRRSLCVATCVGST
jgi:hypothetical protein